MLLDTNIDVSRHIIIIDTPILLASNMNQKEYFLASLHALSSFDYVMNA
jgi:hypothetical protein